MPNANILFHKLHTGEVRIEKAPDKKLIGKRVLGVNAVNLAQEGVNSESLMRAFSEARERVTVIIEGGKILDIQAVPLSTSLRFRDWFEKVLAGKRGDNHQPPPSLENRNFRQTMGVNPKTGKIRLGATPSSSFYRRIFDR